MMMLINSKQLSGVRFDLESVASRLSLTPNIKQGVKDIVVQASICMQDYTTTLANEGRRVLQEIDALTNAFNLDDINIDNTTDAIMSLDANIKTIRKGVQHLQDIVANNVEDSRSEMNKHKREVQTQIDKVKALENQISQAEREIQACESCKNLNDRVSDLGTQERRHNGWSVASMGAAVVGAVFVPFTGTFYFINTAKITV